MATYTFGVTPADFVEIPDTSNPGQTKRPAADSGGAKSLQVRNAVDLSALPAVAINTYGYFTFTTTDIPVVQVSADGVKWDTVFSVEALQAAVNAGPAATQALAAATTALNQSNQAIAASGAAGVTIGGFGPFKTATLAQIGAAAQGGTIDPNQVTGLQPVATSGQGADLTDVGQPGGYPPLNDSGTIPAEYLAGGGAGGGLTILEQNPDGSWPARSTVSNDPTEFVVGNPAYDVTKLPPIGSDAASLQLPNPGLGIPGDAIFNKGVTT